MNFKMKNIINGLLTVVISSSIMLSTQSLGFPVTVTNKAEVAKAIGHFTGTFMLSPMEQMRDVLKYLFDTHLPVTVTSSDQIRFLNVPYIDQNVMKNNVSTTADMMNLFRRGSDVTAPVLAQMNESTCQTDQNTGQQTCYSNDYASTLFDTQQYSSLQAEAAKNYITIVAGNYTALNPPDPSWVQSNADVQKYQAFYKPLLANQTLINLVLAKSYASRIANSNNTPSQSKLYHAIMLGDSTTSSFWQTLQKLPVISQLIIIASDIKAITLSMVSISHRLEMNNVLIATMLAGQNQIIISTMGSKLYKDATRASNQAKQSDDNNNQ